MSDQETIVAVATPFGEGAISVIRMSGSKTETIARSVLTKFPTQPRVVSNSYVVDKEGEKIDEVLVVFFEEPKSYTGEQVIEISCHGGIHVTRRVLERIQECGARHSMPGEFTERAFRNGKIELTQAEAVMDVISAKSDLALRAANNQLQGRLGEELEVIRKDLLGVTAHIEAYIDFPEEDITTDTEQAMVSNLDGIHKKIESLIKTSGEGKILREGLLTAIVGEPNVGKSSLLNVLTKSDRAIVTEVPGTTRDTIEEYIVISGVPLRLIDTAGIRTTEDQVEEKGIEKTFETIKNADMIIEVVDGSSDSDKAKLIEKESSTPHILLLNKSDLGIHDSWKNTEGIEISCMQNDGLEILELEFEKIFKGSIEFDNRQILAVNARHSAYLIQANDLLQNAIQNLKNNQMPELIATDIRGALNYVGEITGLTDTETLLGEIFSSFCIGK